MSASVVTTLKSTKSKLSIKTIQALVFLEIWVCAITVELIAIPWLATDIAKLMFAPAFNMIASGTFLNNKSAFSALSKV